MTPSSLMEIEPCGCEHFNNYNRYNDISYGKNQVININLQTHFKENIMFISWGSPILSFPCEVPTFRRTLKI